MRLSVDILILSTFLLISNDITEAIMYGQVAEPGQFKYQVLLRLKKGTFRGTCGGGIIDETHILTAWHCVDGVSNGDIEVVAGAVRYWGDPNEKLHHVYGIRLHESRACKPGETRCYDIAVLTLTEPIEYSDLISDIPLPDEDISPGDECIFAGWGITEHDADRPSDVLRYGYGKIYARMFCVGWLIYVKDYEFCFHRVRGGVATIDSGDSGSPFVCNGVLTGIIICGTGDPCEPVLVNNVYKLLDFIRETEDYDDCPQEHH